MMSGKSKVGVQKCTCTNPNNTVIMDANGCCIGCGRRISSATRFQKVGG